jgi:hypothetical protein
MPSYRQFAGCCKRRERIGAARKFRRFYAAVTTSREGDRKMDPRQRDVRRHRAERDRLVPDIGEILVRGPVVGDQPGLRRDCIRARKYEGPACITWSRARRGVPSSNSTAPATSILPIPLRPPDTTFIAISRATRSGVPPLGSRCRQPPQPTETAWSFRACQSHTPPNISKSPGSTKS